MADPPQTTIKANTDGDPPKPKGHSAAKVFSTPELMEDILLNLSTRQLFGVLRTCKTFKDTIDGSVKLQRAMFLQPDPEGSCDPNVLRLNPLLNELLFVPSREETTDRIAGFQLERQGDDGLYEKSDEECSEDSDSEESDNGDDDSEDGDVEEEDLDHTDGEGSIKEDSEREGGYAQKVRVGDRALDLWLNFKAKPLRAKTNKPVPILRYAEVKKKKQEVQQSWLKTIAVKGGPIRLELGDDLSEIDHDYEPVQIEVFKSEAERLWSNSATLAEVVERVGEHINGTVREIVLDETQYDDDVVVDVDFEDW